MSEIDISIVLVNYKTTELTDNCLRSIYEFTRDLTFEIIIIDNYSCDDAEVVLRAKYPSLVWLNMSENLGTSKAWNVGIKAAKGKYIVLLNSDTEFVDNAISKLLAKYIAFEKNSKIGLLACQIKGYDDIIQYNSNLRFHTIKKYIYANSLYIWLFGERGKILSETRLKQHLADHKTLWIGLVIGIIRRDIFENDSMYFEEDLFMYSEDVEWCYRLIKKGYRNYFSCTPTILHVNSGSASSSAWKNGQVLVSEWIYFIKIKGKLYLLASIGVLLLNHLFDSMFYLKQKITGRITEGDKASKAWRSFVNDALKRYFWKILFQYRKKTSSAKTFLKYDVKKVS
ncbi:MAG: glycosyltransferase family 2 protein [Bacteroidota bacterium]